MRAAFDLRLRTGWPADRKAIEYSHRCIAVSAYMNAVKVLLLAVWILP